MPKPPGIRNASIAGRSEKAALGSTVNPACACTGRIASATKNASSSGSKRRATDQTPYGAAKSTISASLKM